MTKQALCIKTYLPKVLLLGIQTPYNRTESIDSYFQELRNLAKTNGVDYKHELYIKLRTIDGSYFLTKGKLEDLRLFCEKNEIDHIIISEPLTAQQESNLTILLNCKIFDRTQLILEIFEKHAHSAEGKLQVSIAMLQQKKTRLAGKGLHMSQQSGKLGTRGPGETAKENAMRHIETTLLRYNRELKQIEKSRHIQRRRRLRNKLPHICLIGYTNAGKSTLFNALTRSDVLVEDALFATLDTTIRELYINHKKTGLLSDTVGFIQLLPPRLLQAFKSTLSELDYADTLLHVVDSSDPNWQSHIKVVQKILDELKVDKQTIYVFNKIDRLSSEDPFFEKIKSYMPHVTISALHKETLTSLKDLLSPPEPEPDPEQIPE